METSKVKAATAITALPQNKPITKAGPAPTIAGDNLSLSQIRANVLSMEALIAQHKLTEERVLGGLLNEKLTELEKGADVRRNTIQTALNQVSAQKTNLPLMIENHSVDYGFLKQIEGMESIYLEKQAKLDRYLSDFRNRANGLLAKTNANTIAGTDDMDKRIFALRQMLAELSSSPLVKDLQASSLK